MALSFIQYVGDGVTTIFGIPFQYINQTDVTVKVNGVPATITYPDATHVSVTPAPAVAAIVEVRRTTAKTTANVVFQDGSTLGRNDLNADTNQLLYIAQEAFDATVSTPNLNALNQYDALGHNIIDVADPLGAQDAATKAYVDARAVAAGNVTQPGSSIGSPSYFLKALTASTWGWARTVVADISDAAAFMTTFLQSATVATARTNLGLGFGNGTQSDGSNNITLKLLAQASGLALTASGVSVDPSFLRGFLDGFETSAPGANNIMTFGPGACVDSTNAFLIKNTATFTKTLASWASGTGNGGLDTGASLGAINTPYFGHVIYNPTTGAVDFLLSLSATAPTLPGGFTVFRCVSWGKTDGSKNFLQFQQRDDDFIYGTSVQDATTVAMTATATLQTLSVPSGFPVEATFHVAYNPGASTVDLLITSPDETDQAPVPTNTNLAQNASGAIVAADYRKRTNTSAQIRWRGSAASGTISIATFGFRWSRGRNS